MAVAGTRVSLMLRFETLEAGDAEGAHLVRELFREYESATGISLCFQGFEEELESLPGDYAPPAGTLLVLFYRDQAAGCGAFRKADDGSCELKRIYVRPDYRGMGFGRLVSEELLRRALNAGYRKARLDTLTTMHAAHELYKNLGFMETHRTLGIDMPGTVFMERTL